MKKQNVILYLFISMILKINAYATNPFEEANNSFENTNNSFFSWLFSSKKNTSTTLTPDNSQSERQNKRSRKDFEDEESEQDSRNKKNGEPLNKKPRLLNPVRPEQDEKKPLLNFDPVKTFDNLIEKMIHGDQKSFLQSSGDQEKFIEGDHPHPTSQLEINKLTENLANITLDSLIDEMQKKEQSATKKESESNENFPQPMDLPQNTESITNSVIPSQEPIVSADKGQNVVAPPSPKNNKKRKLKENDNTNPPRKRQRRK